MSSFHKKLSNYADIIVKIGVSLQKGQTLLINASTDSVELVRLLVRKAYEAGAHLVKVYWTDDEILRIKHELAPEESLLSEANLFADEKLAYIKEGAAIVTIASSDPDLLRNIPQERIISYRRASHKASAGLNAYRASNRIIRCLATTPSKAWAAKVFPDLPEAEQVPMLWESIFKMVRADQPDPIQAWEEHLKQLNDRAAALNEKRFKKLHYVAPGTDLTIELPEGHLWRTANSRNKERSISVGNIPTEEVYTVPFAYGVNGTVSSTKPLSYSGTIIDKFTLTFVDGRIVDARAEQGEKVLKSLIETDEGSHYLGEVALVPHQSPISASTILFYKTLFDENASCHLAIGRAYNSCLEGGMQMSREELDARGINNSMTHTDFMIGSDKLNIYGIRENGVTEPVFLLGNWAF